MRFFILVSLSIILACSESFTLGQIDYSNEELSVEEVLKHEDYMIKEKKFDDLRAAYDWIKVKSPRYYKEHIEQKYIDLYGIEGRYERQILEYVKIFPNDSVNAVDKVPNFYYQMGKSFEERSKLPATANFDSAMVKEAIGYYTKSYTYDLHDDPKVQSLAMFYAALNTAKLGMMEAAYRLYERLVSEEKYENTLGQAKGYYKKDNVRNTDDIDVTADMMDVYRQRIVQTNLRKDSLAASVNSRLEASGMITADTLNSTMQPSEEVEEASDDDE
jgi:hypothetical protein